MKQKIHPSRFGLNKHFKLITINLISLNDKHVKNNDLEFTKFLNFHWCLKITDKEEFLIDI